MPILAIEDQIAGLQLYVALVRKGATHSEAVDKVCIQLSSTLALGETELAELRNELDRRAAVTVGAPSVMKGSDLHNPWFDPAKKGEWQRWMRYRRYLLEQKSWPFESVARLDEATDIVIGNLENPSEKGRPFDRRGLVVGSVQSGKTANYMGLMCKAIDAGYKVVIVLTGVHNSLRHQTQIRIDEEVLGETADFTNNGVGRTPIGVGLLEPVVSLPHQQLTAQGEDGDFSVSLARRVKVHPGDTPLVLVTKKNGSILQSLINYFSAPPAKAVNGRQVLQNCPLLLIDDEADQASVNFRSVRGDDNEVDSDSDPSRTNELVRRLLMVFEQRAYVGYTATPFANIYIPDAVDHPECGPDLFPRSFIVSLEPPSDYIGPRDVFGFGRSARPGGPVDGQPVVREIKDQDSIAPDGHKVDHIAKEIPASLRAAVLSFLLSGAARRRRGQGNKHHSMLVHVTRFNGVQESVSSLLKNLLLRLQNILQYRTAKPGTADAYDTLIAEFRALWEKDFVPTSTEMGVALPSWSEIEAELTPMAAKTTLKTINGDIGDVLDYERSKLQGLSVIAVGGDKLSRGLTLEGLTVSYYLRASKMYDTLMQMGRWFGFRPNYSDLCRIYTTRDLIEWFQHIAWATEELREEFEAMRKRGATPAQFGLRVLSHPTMTVTSPLKMREGETVTITYDGTVSETVRFDLRPDVLKKNRDQTELLIQQVGPANRRTGSKGNGSYVWDGVSHEKVTRFLEGYLTHQDSPRANSLRLLKYVRKQVEKGELTSWTIVLVSSTLKAEVGTDTIGALPVVRLKRSRLDSSVGQDASIRRLLSPTDELLDLSVAEQKALREYLERTGGWEGELTASDARGFDDKGPPACRVGRPRTRGVLLIYPIGITAKDKLVTDQTILGMGMSFPRTENAAKVEYVVNPVWLRQELAGTAG